MSLSLQLNREIKHALFRQIAEQIRTQIQSGVLPPGTRLPTVRKLSAELSVTRLTIQNAYAELQADDLIESIIGSGTFVSQHIQPVTLPRHSGQNFNPAEVLGDIHHLMHVDVVRKMSATVPDPSLYPVDEFWASLNAVRKDARELLGYGTAAGDMYLRVAVAELLHGIGIRATPDELLITNGAMHGTDLAIRAIARSGDCALLDEPTFLVMHNLLKLMGIRPIAIPLDNDGPRLDILERILPRERPRFYYTMPTFHNPTGICFSEERRQSLLDLANRHDLTIIEDDTYGFYAYDYVPPPPLAAMPNSDSVIYIGGFGKQLLPGIRLGHIRAAPRTLDKITHVRELSDLSGVPLMQRATAHFLNQGGFKRHLKRTIPVYRQRRDSLMQALDFYMPGWVTWTHPPGGYCSWLTMPRLFEPGELYRSALQHGIAITAGEAFLSAPTDNDHIRLSFAGQTREGIYAGVEQLAKIIKLKAASR